MPEDHEPDGPRADLLRSVGCALPWVELRVIDPNTLDDAPTGSVGEIWVRSDIVMKGYWNQPQATRDAIMDGGWLRTGEYPTRSSCWTSAARSPMARQPTCRTILR